MTAFADARELLWRLQSPEERGERRLREVSCCVRS